MKLKDFLRLLLEYYNNGVPGTNLYCKFYAQANTFSFELYKDPSGKGNFAFTPNNRVYQSVVHGFWANSEDTRMTILEDIWEEAVEVSIKIQTKVAIAHLTKGLVDSDIDDLLDEIGADEEG